MRNATHQTHSFLPVRHYESGLSRYGYLYDVEVEVLPASESVVIEVLYDKATT